MFVLNYNPSTTLRRSPSCPFVVPKNFCGRSTLALEIFDHCNATFSLIMGYPEKQNCFLGKRRHSEVKTAFRNTLRKAQNVACADEDALEYCTHTG